VRERDTSGFYKGFDHGVFDGGEAELPIEVLGRIVGEDVEGCVLTAACAGPVEGAVDEFTGDALSTVCGGDVDGVNSDPGRWGEDAVAGLVGCFEYANGVVFIKGSNKIEAVVEVDALIDALV